MDLKALQKNQGRMCLSTSSWSLLSSVSAGETSLTHASLWGKAVELICAGGQREGACDGAGLEPPVRRAHAKTGEETTVGL